MLEPKSEAQRELDRNLGNDASSKTTSDNHPSTLEENCKVMELQGELKRVRDEFNQQRAKMKELYLAKEGNCFLWWK